MPLKGHSLVMNPLKLGISIRVVARTLMHFPGTLQTVALLPQEDPHRVGTWD